MTATLPATKSKTLATWIALALGSLGAHRFYLHGSRDRWAWLHPLPALLGLVGAVCGLVLGVLGSMIGHRKRPS